MIMVSGELDYNHGDQSLHLFASRSSLANPPLPTPTLPSPLLPSADHLHPRTTPSPTCCPDQVIIDLSTTILIQDYRRYYSQDMTSFRPAYFATEDGSLVTPPFVQDLRNSNLNLVLTAALAMLFARNILVAIDYLRRARMKNKILFYLLFFSQILAPVAIVPAILSSFDQWVDCTVVVVLSSTVGSFALAILLTGILGIKAYKCMNDSKCVALIVISLELAHMGIIIWDAILMRGARRVTGGCLRISDLHKAQISISIQMAQCVFMTLCFVYTSYKYRKTPGARGTISLRMSMEDVTCANAEKCEGQRIPEGCEVQGNAPVSRQQELPKENLGSIAPKSMASSLSRLSKLLSDMVNLRKVMRDELMYTCITTVIITAALVLAFTGVHVKNGLSGTGWIFLIWGLISISAIHSSGRVINRHERQALARRATSRALCGPAMGHTLKSRPSNIWLSPNSNLSQARPRRNSNGLIENDNNLDPFSETRQLHQPCGSCHSCVMSFSTSNLPSPLGPVITFSPSNEIINVPSSAQESVFPISRSETPAVLHEGVEDVRFTRSWDLGEDTTSRYTFGSTDSSSKPVPLPP